jgi:Zn-dependent peptidase ImmA (M78 family)
MKILLDKFRPYGWNARAFTEEDVLHICRSEGIELAECQLTSSPGLYATTGGRCFIALDSRLRGIRRLHVLLHELAHHFLHVPTDEPAAHFFRLRPDTKQEFEAEAFAAVALLPEPLLRRLLSEASDFEAEGFTKDIVEFRLKVLDLYGI